MEYVDLKGFAEFIRERNLVAESRCSYYLNWVRRFLMSEFGSSELAAKDKVEGFADQTGGRRAACGTGGRRRGTAFQRGKCDG